MGKITVFIMTLFLVLFAGCRPLQGELSQAGPKDTPAPAAAESTPVPESTPAPESAPVPENAPGAEADGGQRDTMLTEEQAREKALAHAGLSGGAVTFTEAGLDFEDGRKVYELEFRTDTYAEYEYKIDAYTGEVISYKSEAAGQEQSGGSAGITAEEAEELAHGKVPGAAREDIWEFGRDEDGGHTVYEGKIVYGGFEYEFEIDAGTGTFIEWDREPAD